MTRSPLTKEENEGAFTLIELLVVILIIGILAAIAIPVFLNQRKAAVDASVISDVKNAATQVETWSASHPGKPIPGFGWYPNSGSQVLIWRAGTTPQDQDRTFPESIKLSSPTTTLEVSPITGSSTQPDGSTKDVPKPGAYTIVATDTKGSARTNGTNNVTYNSIQGGLVVSK